MYSDASSVCQGKQLKPTNTCLACDALCDECTGPAATNCVACAAGKYLVTAGTCAHTCPAGSYNAANFTCPACAGACATCSGVTRPISLFVWPAIPRGFRGRAPDWSRRDQILTLNRQHQIATVYFFLKDSHGSSRSAGATNQTKSYGRSAATISSGAIPISASRIPTEATSTPSGK